MAPLRRGRSRRARLLPSLLLLTLVPCTALVAVWASSAVQTLSQSRALSAQANLGRSLDPQLDGLRTNLEVELRQSLAWLDSPSAGQSPLETQQAATNASIAAVGDLRQRLAGAPGNVQTAEMPFATALAQFPLTQLRAAIANRAVSDAHVIEAYESLINSEITSMFNARQVPQGSLVSNSQPLSMLIEVDQAIELEDAVMSGALPSGQMSAAQRVEFVGPLGLGQSLLSDVVLIQTPSDRAVLDKTTSSPAWTGFQEIEDYVITAPATNVPLTQFSTMWRPALDQVEAAINAQIAADTTALLSQQSSTAHSLMLHEGAISLAGLLAVLLSVGLAWRVSSSLLHRMAGLRTATLDLANKSLPDVVSRLNRGEQIDAQAEAGELELDYGSDQVGQVAQAFNVVQRSAIGSAVALADARRGFQNAIRITASRTQNLVNRQLAMLDEIERKHQDPDVLEDVYRLDSQATQMRRYEENLLIISGGRPSRRWTEPVSLVDVLRSAAGEVSEYQRITVTADDRVSLIGTAVADVVHLIAELLDNAVKFSPSICPVFVKAGSVAKGAAIEIEDRGIGMTTEQYAAVNQRLAQPPSFDVLALSGDGRLGMFVVAWLGSQRDIQVTLRPSPFGGTSVVILIPETLLVRELEPANGSPFGEPIVPLTLARLQPLSSAMPAAQTASGADSADSADFTQSVPLMQSAPSAPAAPTSPFAPAASAPDLAPDPTGPADTPEADVLPPLPSRVPQASLARELRIVPNPTTLPSQRSPERGANLGGTRNNAERSARVMSAFQHGTTEARHRRE